MAVRHEGGCLCGNLRYAVEGGPARVTICHCTFCQKITGAGYLVEPVFPRDAFSSEGNTAGYDHISDGSGATVTVRYCPTCGTKICLDLARFPDVVGIVGGTFDDPNWFPRSGTNVRHIFAGSAQAGTTLPAGVDIYEEHAVLSDGSTARPFRLEAPLTVGPDGGLPEGIG